MSEAIIARRIKKIEGTIYNTIYNDIYVDVEVPVYDYPKQAIITTSETYTVTNNLVGNSISVALYGAKGSDTDTSQGEPGEVVIETLSVNPGESIPVYIGSAGNNGNNGEPSSFGTYIVANGGKSAEYKSETSDSNYINNGNGYAVITYLSSEDNNEEETQNV